jgi:Leucine-rich repeat (LRR) protein
MNIILSISLYLCSNSSSTQLMHNLINFQKYHQVKEAKTSVNLRRLPVLVLIMKFLIISTFLLTFVSSRELPCQISFGIFCKVVGEDVHNETDLMFDVGSETTHADITTLTLLVCKMNEVPSGIFESFGNLSNLVLRENELKEWKAAYLVGGNKLQFLYVTENQITSLPAKAFVEAPNLRVIAFTHNKIIEIAPEAFAGLSFIEDLQFNGNQLGLDLRANTFNDVSYVLKRFSLAENEIEEFPEGFFAGFRDLNELNIRGNKFKEIDVKILPESLKKIDVGELKFDLVSSSFQ